MGNIYSHSKATIIHLGPLTANLRAVLEYVRSNAPPVATVDNRGNTIISYVEEQIAESDWDKWIEEEELSSAASKTFAAFSSET
ncbi:hypothetical protein C8034_v008426 [Colletotrichum sidae]|uniref:Uncharacterized protein n=1 Tax=Colletotrichum sidae TaxID=1347389 RepID=A0A4R8TMQ0_9PEZI|nr:hypothetical protein C8034_v008426 [Colletotrichum sidae]